MTLYLTFGIYFFSCVDRDIKGANLLVNSSGVVKLADFGLTKHLTGPAANLSVKGTYHWMAPEIFKRDLYADHCCSSVLALAVDIWSLGCTSIETSI
ncbi:mitogen-activated protein kinase kinase kinase 5-like [Quercus robur]|uniref:mitogen-activated protein kinase kinase kinase 5-like n=1 Tax=Quercus robur TaxID=38942 RepID=UPI002161A3CA|nr:mitogen-activated protein kinase kinase kinase 5-like [Quercus robur]